VPPGVSTVFVSAIAGGGGGWSNTTGPVPQSGATGGGSGGQIYNQVIPVTAGNLVFIEVGFGGASRTNSTPLPATPGNVTRISGWGITVTGGAGGGLSSGPGGSPGGNPGLVIPGRGQTNAFGGAGGTGVLTGFGGGGLGSSVNIASEDGQPGAVYIQW
jgi:hypothetical protein